MESHIQTAKKRNASAAKRAFCLPLNSYMWCVANNERINMRKKTGKKIKLIRNRTMHGPVVEFKYKMKFPSTSTIRKFHYYCRWSFVKHENVIFEASLRHLDAKSVTTETLTVARTKPMPSDRWGHKKRRKKTQRTNRRVRKSPYNDDDDVESKTECDAKEANKFLSIERT